MRPLLFVVPTLRGGGAERVMVTLLRHLDPTRFRRILAVVDLRDGVYREYVPSAVELVLVVCTRIGEKRWRAAGLDIDGKHAPND